MIWQNRSAYRTAVVNLAGELEIGQPPPATGGRVAAYWQRSPACMSTARTLAAESGADTTQARSLRDFSGRDQQLASLPRSGHRPAAAVRKRDHLTDEFFVGRLAWPSIVF